jgi:DNA polymerase-3 subunit delta'
MARVDSPSEELDPAAPRRNPTLLGHGAAEMLLARSAESGRLPHAILIGGPRGIGKATLAFRFARWLLARDEGGEGLFGASEPAADLALDPRHPVARRVAAGGHADLLVVERQWDPKRKRLRSEIVAEDARAIAEFFHKTAAEGGWRIAIVDGAEEMNRHAANGILKILEEPPSRSLLILVSHAPGRLLPTIRSRCRRLLLQPLAEDEVVALLAAQRPELEETDRRALARLAEGSIGRALELADSGGLALQARVAALLATLPSLDVVQLHALADSVARGEDDAYRALADLLTDLLRRTVVDAAIGEPGNEGSPLARLMRRGNLDAWMNAWDDVRSLFARAEGLTLDRKQTVLDTFLRLERAAR